MSVLLDMEPELQLLRGLVVLLQALSCQDDAVEPIALAALARLGEEALERSEACWRQARDAAGHQRDA